MLKSLLPIKFQERKKITVLNKICVTVAQLLTVELKIFVEFDDVLSLMWSTATLLSAQLCYNPEDSVP